MSNSPFDPNSPIFPWYPPPVNPQPPRTLLGSLLQNLPPVSPPAVDPQPYWPTLASLLLDPPPKPMGLGTLLGSLPFIATRPRIFFSYQHATDQYYYNEFSRIFHDTHECVYDKSLDNEIDSDDHDYIKQRIRDEFISGTSCTIVLVGPTTYQRKHVDWEIKATLDKGHGLIGIQLPNVIPNYLNRVTVPERLNANINSGYALWQGFTWYELIANPALLNQLVQIAADRDKKLIVNPKDIKKQNG